MRYKNTDQIAEDIQHLLQLIEGQVTLREGLQETPQRVAKAYQHWFGGYHINPADVLKTFEDGADGYDEMVLECDIPVWSHCEHHMAPFFGTCNIAYVPDGRIVGLSKLTRLVDVFARRLQVQERLTAQVADALQEHLKPKAVGVVMKCRHLCKESRGVKTCGSNTITSSLQGAFREDPAARAEFLTLAAMRQV